LAVTTSDGYEFYAKKSEDIYGGLRKVVEESGKNRH